MKTKSKKSIKETIFLIFEILLLIGLYIIFGVSDEIGWLGSLFVAPFLWICINIPIAISTTN